MWKLSKYIFMSFWHSEGKNIGDIDIVVKIIVNIYTSGNKNNYKLTNEEKVYNVWC